MNRVELLNDKRNLAVVKFREFIVRSRDSKNKFFFIVEGKDDPKYYSSVINSILGSEWCFVIAEGKKNVLKVRSMILSNVTYSSRKVGYMVDRDFDRNNLPDDVYVTPTYSVENFYLDDKLITDFVERECNSIYSLELEERVEIIEFIREVFVRCLSQYFENKKTITANLLYFYIKNHTDINIPYDKLFKFDLKFDKNGNLNVSLKLKKEALLFFSHKSKIQDLKDFSGIWKHISCNPELYFRGKQNLIFFKEFFKCIKNNGFVYNLIFNKFNKKLNYSGSALEDNIMLTLSAYVGSPKCLRNYIKGMSM